MPEIQDELQRRGQSSGSYYGTIVMIDVKDEHKTRLGPDYSLEGLIWIFDVVNNQIVTERRMGFDEADTKRLYYVWDGRNDSGRDVGTGTYLAIVKVTDDTGFKWTEEIRLGVKR
jgi:hypothetical protein